MQRRLLSAALVLSTLLSIFVRTTLFTHSATALQIPSQSPVNGDMEQVVNVIVAGATGDLAAKYLWVTMFRLALQGKSTSRQTFRFFAGASDSLERGRIWHKNFFDEKFAERVCGVLEDNISADQLKCREFLEMEFKQNVQYAPLRTENNYRELGRRLAEVNENFTSGSEEGRIVYLAIPPQFFLQSCELIHRYLRPQREETEAAAPFLRVVVEKPFGRDLQSAHKLATRLRTIYTASLENGTFVTSIPDSDIYCFQNDELFVMDHYAGKPVVHAIRNYFQLNAAELHPFWNSNYIYDIRIEMTETATLQNRVRYFDSAGIIRDIMVNHLQLLLNVAVAPSFDPSIYSTAHSSDAFASRVHDAQIRFIESLHTPSQQMQQPVFVAQYDEYAAHYEAEMNQSIDESDHFTPTAAWIELASSLEEWRNTAFRLAAAKATAERLLSVTVTFRAGVFQAQQCFFAVIIQRALNANPSEGHRIEWSCDVSKVLPDLQLPSGWEYVDVDDQRIITSKKDDHGTATWELGNEPSAYDFLLREIVDGAIEHFADLDEVEAAWTLWTPVVNAAEATLDDRKYASYPVGTSPWYSKPHSSETSQEFKEEL
ncbi:hypothetical protein F442_12706 [Phytophthora nicotianae P10297]|uniref:glucose-6-phosphate dehydrogenase (NADP(+)) n=1 Tax=Phytophthora nicotianae P10297 TaxID=1317064 RepID=W2Z0V2_PHYNI|nr:hypothetical protein F442_12706 [Phytophthora nicotianae P10297]